MKFASYSVDGAARFGLVTEAGLVDLNARTGFASLKAMIAGGGLETVSEKTRGVEADRSLESVELLPVIPDAGKIICVGLNYHDHVEETGRSLTEYPTLFVRFHSSLVGHEQPMVKPAASDKFDYEGELAVIIGKPGRHIAKEDAFAHVAGYAPFNDGSVRDWQGHTTQFTPGKNFDASGAFGPAMVMAEAVGPLDDLVLSTRFNGSVVQNTRLALMITPIPELIAYISSFARLEPGDVIVTGTPGGVGMKRKPPLYMKPGDVVEVEIDQIGTLRNRVVAGNV